MNTCRTDGASRERPLTAEEAAARLGLLAPGTSDQFGLDDLLEEDNPWLRCEIMEDGRRTLADLTAAGHVTAVQLPDGLYYYNADQVERERRRRRRTGQVVRRAQPADQRVSQQLPSDADSRAWQAFLKQEARRQAKIEAHEQPLELDAIERIHGEHDAASWGAGGGRIRHESERRLDAMLRDS
jgi:hypothetical protein